MLTEEQLQDALKCDDSRDRCKECGLLNYMGQDDCVRRLAETAVKLEAEVEKLRDRLQISPYGDDLIDQLEESIGYCKFDLETIRAERDAMRKDLEENPMCQTCIREETCESSNSLGCGTGEWEWRGPIESKGVTVL